jgi:hypothetical protein
MGVFFLAAMWLAINHVDTRAPDYPLVRIKYGLLLLLLPVLASASGWNCSIFSASRPTSSPPAAAACFPARQPDHCRRSLGHGSRSRPFFSVYSRVAAAIGVALWHWRRGSRRSGYLLAAASAAAFVAAIIGVLSFISLYIYEHPHHHCPFCIFKPEYDYQGYWLYLPLFTATAAGLGRGLAALCPGAQPGDIIPGVSSRLAGIAAVGYSLFIAVATYFVLASKLILMEH